MWRIPLSRDRHDWQFLKQQEIDRMIMGIVRWEIYKWFLCAKMGLQATRCFGPIHFEFLWSIIFCHFIFKFSKYRTNVYEYMHQNTYIRLSLVSLSSSFSLSESRHVQYSVVTDHSFLYWNQNVLENWVSTRAANTMAPLRHQVIRSQNIEYMQDKWVLCDISMLRKSENKNILSFFVD